MIGAVLTDKCVGALVNLYVVAYEFFSYNEILLAGRRLMHFYLGLILRKLPEEHNLVIAIHQSWRRLDTLLKDGVWLTRTERDWLIAARKQSTIPAVDLRYIFGRRALLHYTLPSCVWRICRVLAPLTSGYMYFGFALIFFGTAWLLWEFSAKMALGNFLMACGFEATVLLLAYIWYCTVDRPGVLVRKWKVTLALAAHELRESHPRLERRLAKAHSSRIS